MADNELGANWVKTEKLIRQATAAFRRDGSAIETIDIVNDYLEHNELGLAAEQLADAAVGMSTIDLWVPLVSAALEMGMADKAREWIRRIDRYPCPCCGHLVFAEGPGSSAVCQLCFWEDDIVQLRWPALAGGANRPSLVDAQKTAAMEGAMEQRFAGLVRAAAPDELLEPGWRPVDPAIDSFEDWPSRRAPWPDDLTSLYYWRR